MPLPRRDPYLWIHLAGLATVPLWLDLCLSGLAVGDPLVPPWLELTLLGWVGTVPILWMQLQRPFYIFSVPGLAVRPDTLGESRCRLLTLQRTWLSRGLVCLSAISLFCILYWLYQLAPVAADMTPFAAKSRTEGWLICASAFLAANLFVQVPATVIPLLLTSSKTLESTSPYEPAEILNSFMVVGFRVAAILPDLIPSVTDTSFEGHQTVASATLSAIASSPSAIAQTKASTEAADLIHPPDVQPSETEKPAAPLLEESAANGDISNASSLSHPPVQAAHTSDHLMDVEGTRATAPDSKPTGVLGDDTDPSKLSPTQEIDTVDSVTSLTDIMTDVEDELPSNIAADAGALNPHEAAQSTAMESLLQEDK